MSNKKINSKMLKNLIKEVLEEQRLDEFKKDGYSWNPNTSTKARQALGKNKNPYKGAPNFNSLKDLAKTDGTANDLTKVDIDDGATGNDAKKLQTVKDLASNTTVNTRVQNYAAKALKGKQPGPGPGPNNPPSGSYDLGKTLKNYEQKIKDLMAETPPNKTEAQKYLDATLTYVSRYKGKKASDFGKTAKFSVLQRLINGTGPNPPPAHLQKVSTAVKDYFDELGGFLNTGITSADISMPSFADDFSAIDVSRKDDLDISGGANVTQIVAALKSQLGGTLVDQSVANAFAILEGNTVEARFEDLAAAMKTVSNGTFPTDDKELLELSVKIDLAVKLGNLAKIEHASAAGFAFEKYIASMFAGMGAGPLNGAIDAALRDEKGAIMPTSQKLLGKGGSVDQASKSTLGLDNFLAKFDYVIYMAAIKTTSTGAAAPGSGYTNLDIYILRISEGTTNKTYKVEALGTDGKIKHTAQSTKDKDDNLHVTIAKDLGKNYTVRIPVLDKKSSEVNAIAKYVSSQIASNKVGILQRVEAVYRRLENMKRNTTSYRATASSGKTAGPSKLTAADYISQVAKDYTDIKADFNAVFKPVTPNAIAEGAKKITSKMLKKLIQETLKK